MKEKMIKPKILISNIFIPTVLQQDRLQQLETAVFTAAAIDRTFPLKGDQYNKTLKGFALGAYRELASDGLGREASVIIYQAKR